MSHASHERNTQCRLVTLANCCTLKHRQSAGAALCVDVTSVVQSWKGTHWRASGGNEEKMQFIFAAPVFRRISLLPRHSSDTLTLRLWSLPRSAKHLLIASLCPDICTNCNTNKSQNSGRQLSASSCLSVRLSAWNNSAHTGRIFVKFAIWVFFENLSSRFKFH